MIWRVVVFFGLMFLLFYTTLRFLLVLHGIQPNIQEQFIDCSRCGTSLTVKYPRPNESCDRCGNYFYADVAEEERPPWERPLW